MTGFSRTRSLLLGGLLLATTLLGPSGGSQPAPTRQAQAIWGGDAPSLHHAGAAERVARAGYVG